MFSVLLGVYLQVELIHQMTILFIIEELIEELPDYFPQCLYHLHFHQQGMSVLISPYPHQHLLSICLIIVNYFLNICSIIPPILASPLFYFQSDLCPKFLSLSRIQWYKSCVLAFSISTGFSFLSLYVSNHHGVKLEGLTDWVLVLVWLLTNCETLGQIM